MKLSKIKLNSQNKPVKNCVVGEEEFKDYSEMLEFVTKNTYSPYQFKGQLRRSSEFKCGDVFGVDIDEGVESLDDLKNVIKNQMNVSALIVPTKSHMKEKITKSGDVSPACPRCRILFETDRSIKSVGEIKMLFGYVQKYFPTMDEACKDGARIFYPSPSDGAIIIESENKLKVIEEPVSMEIATSNTLDRDALRVEHGKLRLRPSSYDYFKNGAPVGHRATASVNSALDAKQQLWSKEEYKSMLDIVKFPWMDDQNNRDRIDDVFANRDVNPPRLPRNSDVHGTGKTDLVPDNHALGIISKWLEDNGYSVSYDRTIIGANGSEIGLDILKDNLIISLARLNITIKSNIIDSAINLWVAETREFYKNDIRDRLCRNDNFDNNFVYGELRKFLGVYKQTPTDLDVKVLAHQIWHIKRKLCGIYDGNINPLMFVMCGREQGTGKSWGLARYLLSPLEDLLLPQASFKVLTDERESGLLNDSFAIIFDEMSHSDRSSMEAVKSIITGVNFKQRVMRENFHTRLKINTTFFGTAQESVEVNIKDDTGMRRFYEVTVDRSREETRKCWKLLNKINYLEIFASLNHLGPSPVADCLDDLYAAQELIRHKKPVEAWLNDVGYSLCEVGTSSRELLLAFNDWFSSGRYNPTGFGREMSALGFKKFHTMKGNFWNIKMNSTDY